MVAARYVPLAEVYPRVCGGTAPPHGLCYDPPCLSPRMRGNRRQRRGHCPNGGSIPAYAGEPLAQDVAEAQREVYPRVCGGTISAFRCIAVISGLSPRMRGNPQQSPQVKARIGSIPAYAGEPASSMRSTARPAVYPRVCGGTNSGAAGTALGDGLSPRMRGNHIARYSPVEFSGSIPAYAGEPLSASAPPTSSGVYPRVCGGTISVSALLRAAGGLSPRMRGNPPAPT